MERVQTGEESIHDLVALLRENYWYLSTTGAEAMRDLWGEMASNRSGFEETAAEMNVSLDDFAKAAGMLGEWLRINGMLHKSPMEASVEIRTEKLGAPPGPR
jgi:hypothetical protein